MLLDQYPQIMRAAFLRCFQPHAAVQQRRKLCVCLKFFRQQVTRRHQRTLARQIRLIPHRKAAFPQDFLRVSQSRMQQKQLPSAVVVEIVARLQVAQRQRFVVRV